MSSKKLKRFLSVMLSLSMALSVNATGFAAEIAPDSVGVQAEADVDAPETKDAEAEGQQEEALPEAAEDSCAESGHVFEGGVCTICQEAEDAEAGEAEKPEAEEPAEEGTAEEEAAAEDEVLEAEDAQEEVFAAQESGTAPQADVTTPSAPTDCEGDNHVGYTVTVVRAASCTASGMGKRACQCKKDSSFVTLKPRHTYQKIDTATGNPVVGEDGGMVPKDLKDLTQTTEYLIRAEATCTSSGLTTYKCTKCNGTVNVTTAPKKHSFERFEGWPDQKPPATKPGTPTCGGEPAVNVWECEEPGCDYTYEEAVQGSVAHTYVSKTLEPTCTTPRLIAQVCSECGNVDPDTEPVEAEGEQKRRRLGHSFEALNEIGVVVDEYVKEDGTFTVSTTAKPVEEEPATCLKDGYKTYRCEDRTMADGTERKGCGVEYTVVVKARGGHEEKEQMDYIPPTCTENAKYVMRCKHCNDVIGEEIDALDMYLAENDNNMEAAIAAAKDAGAYQLGHIWVEEENPAFPATCTEDGIVTFNCSRCSATETREVPARHDFEDENHNLKPGIEKTDENKLVIYKDPTCTEDGIAYCTCHCGVRRTDIVIPATGHDYGKVTDSYDNYTEETDDGVLTQKDACHDGEVVYTCKNPGDGEDGTCGHSYTVNIPAKPHTPEAAPRTTTATCTEPGMEATFCSVCQEPIGDVKVLKQKLGHTFEKIDENGNVVLGEDGEPVINENAGQPSTVPATCMAEGSQTYSCHNKDCTATHVVTIPKKPHNMELDMGENGDEDPIIPPTCKANAQIKVKCTNEGCTYTDQKDITTEFSDEDITAMGLWQRDGHELELRAIYTEATCTRNGISLYGCTMCDYTERKTVAAHHSYIGEDGELIPADEYEKLYPSADGKVYLKVLKAADCENDGTALYTCANEGCAASTEGHTYEGKIEKLGHEFDDGTVTLNPIECQPGTITYTCQRVINGKKCGVEDSQLLPESAKEHLYEKKSIKATCVEPAKTGIFCKWCDKVKPGTTPEVDKDSKPNGHSYVGDAETGLALTDADGNTVYVKADLKEGTDYTVDKAETCTETGARTYKCTHKNASNVPCGEEITLTVPAQGHDWETNEWLVQRANCTYPSRKEKACGRTGCKEKQMQLIGSKPAEGDEAHDWQRAEADADVKCGEVTLVCQTNPEHTKKEVVHDWKDKEEVTAVVGGFKIIPCKAEGCDATMIDSEGAQEGYVFCDTCEIGVQPESYGGYDATCEKAGKTDKDICPTCSKTLKEAEDIPAIGHEYVRKVVKEPSCVDGYSEEVCQHGCGKTRNREAIPATGKHTFGAVDQDKGYAECTNDCGTKDVIAGIRMEASKEGGKNIIRLIADTQLVDTDKYDILERGVLYYTAAEGYPGYLIMEDVDNGTKVRMAEVTQTGSIGGRLPINVGTATNRVVYARAYVVVMEKNGNSKTPEKRYSETISGSFESLGGGL